MNFRHGVFPFGGGGGFSLWILLFFLFFLDALGLLDSFSTSMAGDMLTISYDEG